MRIVEWPQHRALAFVAACTRSRYRPTPDEVIEWLKSPQPAPQEYEQTQIESTLANVSRAIAVAMGRREVVKSAEDVIQHLIRLRWLENTQGLQLTRLGEALLLDVERATKEEPRAVVVLPADDPLAYARLIGQLAAAGEAFLVDPYFRIGQLPVILDSTSISRVLISKQYKNSKVARAELQTALMTLPRLRHIEIRATASDTLHDRVLITEDDDVYMLGASLQSIGTSTTVYMAVPKTGVAPIRGEMEDLWNGAELVGVSVTEAIKDENLDET